MKKLILFAIFIYFIIGTLTYHSDNKLVLTWASLNHGTVWNIWNVDTQELAGIDQFNYPPLHFYLDKLQYFISYPVGGEGYYDWFSNNLDRETVFENLTRYSFAVKFPLMIFAFGSAYLIYLIAKLNKFDETKSLMTAGIWLFNPVTLYSVPIMGQNDVMAIFAFLFGWYLLQKRKLLFSTTLFGLSASIKMFPIIWVPFLLLYEKKISIKKRIGVLFGSFFVYFLTLLPFLSNSNFKNAVLNTGIDRFFIARLDLGYSDYVLIVPILLMILFTGILIKVKKNNDNILLKQSSALLLFNMIFLFFNHFHPQWFLWLVPFWGFWFLQQNKNRLLILLTTIGVILSWILVILLFKDSALTFGILTPLNGNLSILPPLREILLAKNISVELFNNYGHTFLAGIALIFMIFWFNNDEKVVEFKLQIFKTKLRLNKLVVYISVLLTSLLFVFLTIFFAQIIPAPLSDSTPKIIEYPYLVEPIQKEFTASYDRLNRIDIIFSDDELKNLEDYTIRIKNQDEELIFNQTFNGLNVGYRTTNRFTFPAQPNSKDKTYLVELIPPLESEYPLRIASYSKDTQGFIFQPFYTRPPGIKYILNESISSMKNVINKNALIYLLSAIVLWFAL